MVLFAVVVIFGCQTEEVVRQQSISNELFHKTTSLKKAENLAINKLMDKANYLPKIEMKHIDFANTLEVGYVGLTDARGLVTPINDGSGLDKNLINFIGTDGSFLIDLMMVIETEQKSENSYVTSYYDNKGSLIFYLTIIDNEIRYYKGNGFDSYTNPSKASSRTAGFFSSFAECGGSVFNSFADGSFLGTAAGIGCIVFSGYCAAGIVVGCTIMAVAHM